MVLETKIIKPQKMNVDAIRAEIEAALEKEGKEVKQRYEKTTATWKHKPKFEILTDVSGDEAQVLVGTDDEIYGYVDQGTRPHVISARRAPTLAFQTGFQPKTKPRQIKSYRGKKFGPRVFPRQVRHPGTKAREFSDRIAEMRRRPFTRLMIQALQRGSKKVF